MEKVIEFWFRTLQPSDWFSSSDDLDARIKEQFEATYHQVVAGETSHWRDTPEGRLAEIIVLDQFSRNMFRGTAASFIADPLALALAQEAVRIGDDLKLSITKRVFLYMPYMHSESRRFTRRPWNCSVTRPTSSTKSSTRRLSTGLVAIRIGMRPLGANLLLRNSSG